MNLPQTLGLLRSLLIYYGIPWRPWQMRRLYRRFIRPGDLCFDVGAHVGSRVRVWRQLGARVVAVEPQPHLMAFLQRWYGRSYGRTDGRSPHVTLIDHALGAQPGQATLHVSRRTPTVTTLSRAWIDAVRRDESFAGVQWDTAVTVPVTTLDALIEKYGRPAFCKIDVEGYELEVLRGLSQPIPAISFEYIPAAIDTALGCVAHLQQLGDYRFNLVPGESHRLHFDRWLAADEITTTLRQRALSGGSGDVYAIAGPQA